MCQVCTLKKSVWIFYFVNITSILLSQKIKLTKNAAAKTAIFRVFRFLWELNTEIIIHIYTKKEFPQMNLTLIFLNTLVFFCIEATQNARKNSLIPLEYHCPSSMDIGEKYCYCYNQKEKRCCWVTASIFRC